MSMIRWSPTAIAACAAVLMFALCAPIAVSAEDEVHTDEQVLAAEDQYPALAPAAVTVTPQVSSDVRWAPEPGPAWLAASRTAAARRAAPAFPEWDAARWAPIEAGPPPQHAYSPESSALPPLHQATTPDDIPAALATGQRAESAHLATVPLPAEDTVDGALAEC